MRSVETEAATIDDAIARALELLHIERDRVDIEILENSSRGLLGFGGKPARIRATVRSPLASGESSTSPSTSPVSRETSPADGTSAALGMPAATDGTFAPTAGSSAAIEGTSVASAVDHARRALEVVLDALDIAPPSGAVAVEDGSWRFAIDGDGAGIVIGRHGQTLDAIEYLLSRIASHDAGSPVRITLDVEGYRERRQESLEQTARRAADKVRTSGRPLTLSPMSPRDRRIVHIALSEERGVTTRSQGEGAFRRVVIVPMRASTRPSA
jgi:spoIIIJ-associated protein